MSADEKAGPHHETGPQEITAATDDSTPPAHRSKITDQLDKFNAAWVAQGHRPIAYRGNTGVTQLLPAGPAPDSCRLLLSGGLWGSPEAVKAAASLVHPEDLDEPHKTVWGAVTALASRGITGARAVMDEVIRAGDASQLVRDELMQATHAGGVPEALPYYAAQILADRFRRAVESYGQGAVGWSATASEDE
ncbi:hypothetical protein CEY15_02280 [Dietzia natronolimnaea]|uniref:DNA helicase DnaB-like N-terminal domain-containing protein n=1 Tax=Dietzia natronolimnaea TaxID=161920 RepID=A0A2A2WUI3_9ACTN|nr:hypothetical protein [Dietzia natronolimnaea]PAY24644.1 hypothetical protein CEY15_02280 [Dietzia natronolimnaea]